LVTVRTDDARALEVERIASTLLGLGHRGGRGRSLFRLLG
jgi:hypothetical protein